MSVTEHTKRIGLAVIGVKYATEEVNNLTIFQIFI